MSKEGVNDWNAMSKVSLEMGDRVGVGIGVGVGVKVGVGVGIDLG